ncbi:fluoride efflux transporter CrcB [Siccibacter turicensis]|uniref:fluoride efflux transporter CrcB n=1 Tax=Siccibacter turicensis TaxID=357233 RepID=UPI001021CDFC|nr:fluoride efflux transporter CrcB [Siccibacter turicensis]
MLTSLLAVIIGGGTGSALRWAISNRLNSLFPLLPPGTLVANVLAGLIIGFATALFVKYSHYDGTLKLMITTGLCGGLSTFSTFSEEVFSHLQQNHYLAAATEITAHVLLSLLAVWLGFFLASLITR